MYAPDPVDVHWNFPSQDRTLLWQLYDTSSVYHLSTKGGVDLFMLTDVAYPLSTEVLIAMMSSKLQCKEQTDAADTLLLIIGGQLLGKICEELDIESQAKKRKRH